MNTVIEWSETKKGEEQINRLDKKKKSPLYVFA